MTVTRRAVLATALPLVLRSQGIPSFWPAGKRFAVSLTFDDARMSQPDTGIPFLNKLGAKATFYLNPERAKSRLAAWKEAQAAGHEIAHHSDTHPCTGNYAFSKSNALENYTLERMEKDLDTATAKLEEMFGVKPVSFAYPCGQKFVGRGEGARSYVPLVAKHFLSGRGYLDEAANDPRLCDLASLMGTGFDGLSYDEMKTLVDTAAKDGRWLVFVGHEMGERGFQITDLDALERLVHFAHDPANGIWLDTVETIAKHVKSRQS